MFRFLRWALFRNREAVNREAFGITNPEEAGNRETFAITNPEAVNREAVTITNPNCYEKPSSVTTLIGTIGGASKVIFLPEEKLLAAVSDDFAVRVYDIDTAGTPCATFDQHTNWVYDVVRLDRDLVASVGYDYRLFSWRPKSAQLVGQWKHNNLLHSIVKLDDSRVIVGDVEGNVIVLTHVSGTDFLVHQRFCSSHSDLVAEIVVQGRLIVTCSYDNTAKIWNTESQT